MIKRLIGIAVLLLCAPWVWAEDYYWMLIGASNYNHYSSPGEAHAAFVQQRINMSAPPAELISDSLSKIGDLEFSSTVTTYIFWLAEPTVTETVKIKRYGDSCPSGKIYNNENGTCEENLCEDKKGQMVSFFAKHSAGFPDPHKFCMNGCTIFQLQGECAGSNDDPINDRACWGMAEYWQGEQCTEGEAPAIEGGSVPPKDKDPQEPEEPQDPNQPDPDQCPPGYFYNGSFCSPIEPENDGCPDGMVRQGNHCVEPSEDNPPDNGGGGGGGKWRRHRWRHRWRQWQWG